jgi:SAM-dependent methyltransferase
MLARRIVYILSHPRYHRWDFWRSRCNVCGRFTIFLCTVPGDRWIRSCLFCRSTPKYRALYHALTSYLGADLRASLDRGASVYELTASSPIYRCLRAHAGYSCSAYMSDRPFGIEIRPRVWNQDVQRLTFPDVSFDVVISSETMEHVRRPWSGFAEIHRVLKPGGVHCFTIPYRKDCPTRSRVDSSRAEDVYILPKVYHQDPYRAADSLVFTEFGSDLVELLRPLGFETTECSVLDRTADIQDDLAGMRVFLSVKR